MAGSDRTWKQAGALTDAMGMQGSLSGAMGSLAGALVALSSQTAAREAVRRAIERRTL